MGPRVGAIFLVLAYALCQRAAAVREVLEPEVLEPSAGKTRKKLVQLKTSAIVSGQSEAGLEARGRNRRRRVRNASPARAGGECQCGVFKSGKRAGMNGFTCNKNHYYGKGKDSDCRKEDDASHCNGKRNFWGQPFCKWYPYPTPRPTPATPRPTPLPTPEPTPAPPPEPNVEPEGCCSYKENQDSQCASGDGHRLFELRFAGRLQNGHLHAETRCATDVCNTWKWCKGYTVNKHKRQNGTYAFNLCDLVVDYDLWVQEATRDPDMGLKRPEGYARNSLIEVFIKDPVTGVTSGFNARPPYHPYTYGNGGLKHKPKTLNEWTCYQKE